MLSSVSKIEHKILEVLKERPISVSELARKLRLRRDFLAGYLESMRERGKLRVVQVGRANVYQIVEGERK